MFDFEKLEKNAFMTKMICAMNWADFLSLVMPLLTRCEAMSKNKSLRPRNFAEISSSLNVV